MAQLLDLPPELLIRIFLLFDNPGDVLACSRTNRNVYTLVVEDVRIQYHIETLAARVTNNPKCMLPIAERLARLKRREAAWRDLSVRRSTTVPISYSPTGIYDLSGGVYFLGERQHIGQLATLTRSLRWIRLPSVEEDREEREIQWNKIDVGKDIADLGLALDEHDLVAVAFFEVQQNGNDLSRATLKLSVQLLQLSTGRNHPLASQPTLEVDSYSIAIAPPGLSIEIVGDKIVLLLTFPYGGPDVIVKLFVWNWKTGHLHFTLEAPQMTYQSLFFLSPDVLVLPNTTHHSFELYDISVSGKGAPTAPRLIRTLLLPELTTGSDVLRLACRGEPNPMSSKSTVTHQEPFYDSAEDAIIVVNLLVQNPAIGVFGRIINITVVLHRNALSKLIASPEANSQGSFSTPLPYNEWGPLVTRWFAANDSSTRWITTTCGQRFVAMPKNGGGQVVVRDFGKYATRRALVLIPEDERGSAESRADTQRFIRWRVLPRLPVRDEEEEEEEEDAEDWEMADEDGEEEFEVEAFDASRLDTYLTSGHSSTFGQEVILESGNIVRVVTESTSLPVSLGVFKEEVRSSLPFVESVTEEMYDYRAVLVDDKRILGLMLDENDERIISVDIINFA
ncbi:unnamed protein product [Somion occarium]|uniref:F-box domain-containing protein n=1 Tax=Somion occarium TaxID=3059160 RepID=A0ABP1DYZ5_9APHY